MITQQKTSGKHTQGVYYWAGPSYLWNALAGCMWCVYTAHCT